jgi:DNA-binding FrmR family transcriptional regulator
MKQDQSKNLVAQLNRIKGGLDIFACPESQAAFLATLDQLIARLNTIRGQLTDPAIAAKLSDIGKPIEQVIDFLESAKTDDVLAALLADAVENRSTKPKRVPVDIPANLKNDEIRRLLGQDLTKLELKALAAQRGITVGKATLEEVKRDILRVLDRQEGYERLASPRPRAE